MSKLFDFIKENFGKGVAYTVIFAIMSFGFGITANNYVDGMQTDIQLNALRIVHLEKSILEKEQYDLEDFVFEKEERGEIVKPRIKNRLEKIIHRLGELGKNEEVILELLK